jgi:hypothetical protein
MEPMELTVYKVYKAPPGITFMNNTNTYTRLASSTNVSPAPPFYTQSFAVCDTGIWQSPEASLALLQALSRSMSMMQFPLKICKSHLAPGR